MPPRSRHAVAAAALSLALLTSCTPGPVSNGSFSFDTPNEHVSGQFSGHVAIVPLSSPSPSPTEQPATPTPEMTPIAPTATMVPPTATTVPPTATSTPPPGPALLPAVDNPWPPATGAGKVRPIEIQAWWHGGAAHPMDGFGHIHASAAVPLGDPAGMSGVVIIPVRAVMHSNPSNLYLVHLAMDQGGQQLNIGPQNITPNVVCPYNGITESNCTTNYSIPVDTRLYGNGWKYIYLLVESMTPDNNVFRTSSRIPVYFNNPNNPIPPVGNPTPDSNFDGCPLSSVLGRAWYDSLNTYSDVRAVCLPQGPVSGVHRFYFAGGAGAITKSVTITLSKNHEVPASGPWARESPRAGKVLLDEQGPHGAPTPLDVDTRLLANGWHSLSVRTLFLMPNDPAKTVSVCSYCDSIPDVLEGVVKQWFWVAN